VRMATWTSDEPVRSCVRNWRRAPASYRDQGPPAGEGLTDSPWEAVDHAQGYRHRSGATSIADQGALAVQRRDAGPSTGGGPRADGRPGTPASPGQRRDLGEPEHGDRRGGSASARPGRGRREPEGDGLRGEEGAAAGAAQVGEVARSQLAAEVSARIARGAPGADHLHVDERAAGSPHRCRGCTLRRARSTWPPRRAMRWRARPAHGLYISGNRFAEEPGEGGAPPPRSATALVRSHRALGVEGVRRDAELDQPVHLPSLAT
jgi:hypothetical protein